MVYYHVADTESSGRAVIADLAQKPRQKFLNKTANICGLVHVPICVTRSSRLIKENRLHRRHGENIAVFICPLYG